MPESGNVVAQVVHLIVYRPIFRYPHRNEVHNFISERNLKVGRGWMRKRRYSPFSEWIEFYYHYGSRANKCRHSNDCFGRKRAQSLTGHFLWGTLSGLFMIGIYALSWGNFNYYLYAYPHIFIYRQIKGDQIF